MHEYIGCDFLVGFEIEDLLGRDVVDPPMSGVETKDSDKEDVQDVCNSSFRYIFHDINPFY